MTKSESTASEPRDLHKCLVVVIPGIGGSKLKAPDGTIAWDGSYRALAGLLGNPERLADPEDGLQPAGITRTLTRFLGRAPFYGYQVLMNRLAEEFKTCADFGEESEVIHPEARVVAFTYDFRHDCEYNAVKLEEFIRARLGHHKLGDTRNVIVVAHSMGGIIARTWVERCDRWSTCRYLVTLGTPHHGAPKTLESLVHGYPVWKLGHFRDIRSTLRTWPSTYDLLPMYPVIDSAGKHLTAPDFFKTHLTEFVVRDELSKASDRYRRTTTGWIDRAWSVGNAHFVGTGRTTSQYARWDGAKLRMHTSGCSWLQPTASKIGDGTVPEISAIPMEHQTGGGWHGLRVKHSKMPDAQPIATAVITELRRLADKSHYELFDWWLKSDRGYRGDDSGPQIDIEDAYFAEEDRPRVALEWADHESVWSRRPYYRITPLEDRGLPGVEGSFDSRTELRWEFALPTLRPGTYRIETSPSQHGGDQQLMTEALFDVFDEATIDQATIGKESDHA